MEAIPAVDIRGGRCVRLLRGDYAAETDYGDPIAQAERLAREGATRLHLVDLDAARSGGTENAALIAQIASRLDIPVEVGGGIRERARAEDLLSAGVDRVVLGTAALEDPDFARALAKDFPGRVVIGLDHRRESSAMGEQRVVAVRGWEQASGRDLASAIELYADVPIGAFIITDITADGTLAGPDLVGYELALATTSSPVIASGGIGTLAHLEALARLDHDGHRLVGVVIGKALYSGAMTLQEAIATCAASG